MGPNWLWRPFATTWEVYLENIMSERLGELLVRENLISLAELKKAQTHQRKDGERLTYTLTKLGIVGERDLTRFMSQHYGVPAINLEEFEIDDDVIHRAKRSLDEMFRLAE